MKKMRFAIIGCGKIAKRHAGIIASLKDAELAAVCDTVKEKAQEFGKRYNVNYYLSAEEMLKKEQLDVVNILTPSGNHAQTFIDIVDKVGNVIVEKPMALALKDIDRMENAAEKFKTNLFVVQQNRFNLPVRKLREAVEDGRFGKLVLGTVRVRWTRTQDYYDSDSWRGTQAMDGGVLTNQASHFIDLLTWMMGEVESVMAMAATRLADIETEDTAVVALRFKTGALGIIEATTATRPRDLEGSISILGEKGSVEIGGFSANQMKVWNFADCRQEDKDIFVAYGSNPRNAFGFAHYEYIRNVIGCVKNGKKSFLDASVSRKSLELINAIYKSAATKKEVFLEVKVGKCRA